MNQIKLIYILSLMLVFISCQESEKNIQEKKNIQNVPDTTVSIEQGTKNTDSLLAFVKNYSLNNGIKLDSNVIPLSVKGKDTEIFFYSGKKELTSLYIAIGIGKSGKKSISPLEVNANWIDNSEASYQEALKLLTEPLCYFKDLNNDGHEELIVKDRVHNGNVYNAVVERWFDVNIESLNVQYLFSFESLYWNPFEEVYIKRVLNNGVVSVFSTKNRYDTGELIGSFSIVFNDNSSPQIKNIKVINNRFETVLITGNPD